MPAPCEEEESSNREHCLQKRTGKKNENQLQVQLNKKTKVALYLKLSWFLDNLVIY